MSKSRIANKPVTIPSGVDVKINGQVLSAKGPKGQLTMDLHPFVLVTVQNSEIKVQPNAEKGKGITGALKKLFRSIAGTVRSNINNVVHGVANGFEVKLVLVGVGYRAQAKGKELSLTLGHSHPTNVIVPEGLVVETPTPTEILIKGSDKIKIGKLAAEIKSKRPVEPYKGKGVRYANEIVEIKETKKK